MTATAAHRRLTPLRDMVAYTTGDGVTSLVLNSMGFLMLYYTEALGLDYRLAGLAISTATFWNAIAEPVMGHITDNTRSRFGRRHPYMLLGGLATVLCFLAIWIIPESARAAPLLFWYVIVVNLVLRTAITVFAVPHGALGFEVCTDYTQRTTLQGLRVAFNMLINLAGPALAWMLFLHDRDGVEGTQVASNYMGMGVAFSVAALGFVMLVVFATRRYRAATQHLPKPSGNHPMVILRNTTAVLLDRCPRPVFIFASIAFVGMSLVASLEMYVYIHVMTFSAFERTLVHGTGVVACALGGILSPLLVRRLDKKASIGVAVGILATANVMLALFFVPAWVLPGIGVCVFDEVRDLGRGTAPVALLLFAWLHAMYWAGNGMLTPIAGSMIADASEISRHRTGVLKDGSYSAVYSCITKLSISAGLLLAGFALDGSGFLTGADRQAPEALRNLALITFLGGAAFAVAALAALARYPVTRAYLEELRVREEQLAAQPAALTS